MITQDELKRRVSYDTETGAFIWRVKPRRAVPPGTRAGSAGAKGQRYIMLNKKSYLEHRLAFLWMTGSIPDLVDHINRNTGDNRWCNLRAATLSQNGFNRKRNDKNTTGHKNVYPAPCGNYKVIVTANNRQHYGGYFQSVLAAKAKAAELRAKLHGEYARAE